MRRTFPRSPVVAATARFSDATINTALRGSLIASLIWTLLVGALLLGAILAGGLAAVAAEANEATAPAARPLTGVVIDAQAAGVPAIDVTFYDAAAARARRARRDDQRFRRAILGQPARRHDAVDRASAANRN